MITKLRREQNKSLMIFAFVMLASTSCFMTGCQDVKANESKLPKVSSVPELLLRNEKIQLGKEWDQIQNLYAQQVADLRRGKNVNEAKLNLALLFIKEARVTGEHGHYYPAALKMTTEILENKDLSSDSKFRTLMTKAGIKLSLHEFAEAKEIALQAIKLNALNAQIYGIMVDCHVELGEYEQAVAMADKMISIKPDLRSYSRISYLREIHGDVEGAKEAMKLAVESGFPGTEETAWAMQTLAEMYQLYGEPEKAKKIYNTILASRKDYPFAVGGLASLEFEKGNIKEAEKIIQEAIDIIPEVGFYVQLADLYKAEGKDGQLKEISEEIFVMLKDDVTNGHNMNLEYALLHLELLEDPEKALFYAELEYQKRPENIDVNRLMARIYKSKDDISKSKEHKIKAQKTKSIHPELNLI